METKSEENKNPFASNEGKIVDFSPKSADFSVQPADFPVKPADFERNGEKFTAFQEFSHHQHDMQAKHNLQIILKCIDSIF